ncbi:MAG: DUF2933 domain-containing protein [Thermaceae bacterium]|nr:DUF2933 domain-containing protein [Thermaceae bacterium]
MNQSSHNSPRKFSGRKGIPQTWVLLGFLAVAGFFLITEHRAHLFGALPYLLLLACLLMHAFMHSQQGHGGHASVQDDERRDP